MAVLPDGVRPRADRNGPAVLRSAAGLRLRSTPGGRLRAGIGPRQARSGARSTTTITIGTFIRSDDGADEGAIHTHTLNAKTVRIRPIEPVSPEGPDFRIEANGIELGAAWRRTAKDDREYLSVRLDDPSFAGPIHALLVGTPTGFGLVWSRWTHA